MIWVTSEFWLWVTCEWERKSGNPTWFLQVAAVSRKPRRRFRVATEDFHAQVVDLLLIHDPFLQRLLSVRPSIKSVDFNVVTFCCFYLAGDGQLQRKIVHPDKIVLVRCPLATVARCGFLQSNDRTVDWLSSCCHLCVPENVHISAYKSLVTNSQIASKKRNDRQFFFFF